MIEETIHYSKAAQCHWISAKETVLKALEVQHQKKRERVQDISKQNYLSFLIQQDRRKNKIISIPQSEFMHLADWETNMGNQSSNTMIMVFKSVELTIVTDNSIQQWFQKPMKRKGKTHHNWDKIKAHGKIAEARE